MGTLLALVGAVNRRLIGTRLRVATVLETDDKVGNGHCLVLRKAVVSRNKVLRERLPRLRQGSGQVADHRLIDGIRRRFVGEIQPGDLLAEQQ